MRKLSKGLLLLFILSACAVMFLGVGPAANADSFSGSVYLGGTPIGVIVKSPGVTVLEITDIITENGAVRPAETGGILKGDLITKIDTYNIQSPEDIAEALSGKPSSVKIVLRRRGEELTLNMQPVLDKMTNSYKLGLQVKNELAGVGTLTYVRTDNKRFGGLGHQIYDMESNNRDIYNNGTLHSSTIVGVIKGEPGKTGELRGSFRRKDNLTGHLDKNNFAGVFGRAEALLYDGRPMISLGGKDTVKPGTAYIYTTLDGASPEKYEIEILKAVKQSDPADRSMVLHITDPRLLEKTGGIVQGMSGSPIIQNGRLVGAVTHVFVNDPTRGYGIYIDWMLEN